MIHSANYHVRVHDHAGADTRVGVHPKMYITTIGHTAADQITEICGLVM